MKSNSIFYRCLMILARSYLSPIVSADTVTILSDKWFPVNGDPKSEQPGYMIEIAKTILNKHGHSLDYRLAPWARSIQEVRKGRTDCIVGALKSDAEDFIFPEQSWGKSQFGFYSSATSDWNYQGIKNLERIKIGAISDYSYGPMMDQYIEIYKNTESVQLLSGDSVLEQNIRKLFAKRIDVILSDKLVMETKINTLGLQNKFRLAGDIAFSENIYIACSPIKSSSLNYVKLFSEGIVILRESGELARILNKYGVKDWIDAVE